MITTVRGEQLPGRMGMLRGLVCMNKRQQLTKAWTVCFGSQAYPDYVVPNTGGQEGGGGWTLTPDEAEEMAAHLVRCAAWARAQNTLDGVS